MSKYRRIEVNAYHRKVTVVSGEWRPGDLFDEQPAETDNEVTLNDTDSCEPVEPNSPEGQKILLDAVRSLERRLSPEARAAIRAGHNTLAPNHPKVRGFFLKLQILYQFVCPRALRFARREK